MYMYKGDLALNNLQWLICHKTKSNKTVTLSVPINRFYHYLFFISKVSDHSRG